MYAATGPSSASVGDLVSLAALGAGVLGVLLTILTILPIAMQWMRQDPSNVALWRLRNLRAFSTIAGLGALVSAATAGYGCLQVAMMDQLDPRLRVMSVATLLALALASALIPIVVRLTHRM